MSRPLCLPEALAHGASPGGVCRAIARELCRRYGLGRALALLAEMGDELRAIERGQ
jgi:hypothetical protein